jgi:uncharacterized protein YkwD
LHLFSVSPIRRWAPAALLCQALLVALATAPATSQAAHTPSSSDTILQCVRQDVPLFSQVLSEGSRSDVAAAASTPRPIASPTPFGAVPTAAVEAPSTSPSLSHSTPPPVRQALAAPTLPPPPPATAAPVEQPTAPPPPPTPVSTSPPVDGCDRIIALVNEVRGDNGLPPLAPNAQLGAAAQQYAGFIAANNVLTHTADGRRLDARAEAAGYTTWLALGENLAGGYDTFEEAVSAWMASPGHRENILNPRFTETGVGCAWNADSRYGWFFVQEFGTR